MANAGPSTRSKRKAVATSEQASPSSQADAHIQSPISPYPEPDVQEQIQQLQEHQTSIDTRLEQILHAITTRATSPALLTPSRSPSPVKQQEPPHQRTPSPPSLSHEYKPVAVPKVQWLKGSENYRQWQFDIRIQAETYGVLDALLQQNHSLTRQQETFTIALISSNVIPDIKSSLTRLSSAYAAWNFLENQYGKRSITQIIKKVQDFTFLNL